MRSNGKIRFDGVSCFATVPAVLLVLQKCGTVPLSVAMGCLLAVIQAPATVRTIYVPFDDSVEYYHNYSRVSHGSPVVFSEPIIQRPLNIHQSTTTRSPTTVGQCPPDVVSVQLPVPGECGKFLNCWKGAGFVQDCAPGTLFNANTNQCDFAHKVQCQQPMVAVDAVTTGLPQPHCPPTFNGIIPDYTDCSRFFHCEHGVQEHLECPHGSLFDSSRNVCDIPSIASAHCFNSTGRKPGTRDPKATEPFGTDVDTAVALCPTHSSGLHPHPSGDCSKFLSCAYGQTFEMDCAPGTHFDVDLRTCNFADQAKCRSGQVENFQVTTPQYTAPIKQQIQSCTKEHFPCRSGQCVHKRTRCDRRGDCGGSAEDEIGCGDILLQFTLLPGTMLVGAQRDRWDNVTRESCAMLCLDTDSYLCRSFNYRRMGGACSLSDRNVPMTGKLMQYEPMDYHERIDTHINCTDKSKYRCTNGKCINFEQLCDGTFDCDDMADEKGCDANRFGYKVKLLPSNETQTHDNQGDLHLTAFGKSGFVCMDQFSKRSANVACKELGFALGAAEMLRGQHTAPIRVHSIWCTGNETRLMDCDHSGWQLSPDPEAHCSGVVGVICKIPLNTETFEPAKQELTCNSKDYWQCDNGRECVPLAFVCDGLLDCSDGSDENTGMCEHENEQKGRVLRLVNGRTSNEGRLEVWHHGRWGTVCDDDFNDNAAKVVCKVLGASGGGGAVVRKEAFFGEGSGPIWLDQVYCSLGNETGLDDCQHWNWGEHNCDHSEDVGVICGGAAGGEITAKLSPPPLPELPQRPVERHAHITQCGLRNDSMWSAIAEDGDLHFRVVGGSKAKAGHYPWQAAIRVRNLKQTSDGRPQQRADMLWCGAVIVAPNVLLTAAHCLIGYAKGAYVVVAGDYDTDRVEGTEQYATIDDFNIHEQFRQGHRMNNDIAVVKLKGRGLEFGDHVRAICLPDDTDNSTMERYEDGTLNCTISGFGSVRSGKSGMNRNDLWICGDSEKGYYVCVQVVNSVSRSAGHRINDVLVGAESFSGPVSIKRYHS